MIVQTQGDVSVDMVVEMAPQIPTWKCVMDEAGNPLAHVPQIRERTNDKLAVFSGNGVRTMIDGMRLGLSGHCPYTVLSDFYPAAFDLWHAGKRREAFDMFGRIQAFNSINGSQNYLMVVRSLDADRKVFRRLRCPTRKEIRARQRGHLAAGGSHQILHDGRQGVDSRKFAGISGSPQ